MQSHLWLLLFCVLESLINLNVLKEYYMETEEPEAEDLKAIRSRDKIASETELLKVLDA